MSIYQYNKGDIVAHNEVPTELQHLFDNPCHRHWVDQHNLGHACHNDYKVWESVSLDVRGPEIIVTLG